MKRKLALLLAAAMTLSMLPTTSLFAASTNTLTGTRHTLANKTVLVESGLLVNTGTVTTPAVTNSTGLANTDGITAFVAGDLSRAVLDIEDNSDIERVQSAPYLRIEPKSRIDEKSRIVLTLDGAEWFFRDGNPSNPASMRSSWTSGTVKSSGLEALTVRTPSGGNMSLRTLYEALKDNSSTTTPGALGLAGANNNANDDAILASQVTSLQNNIKAAITLGAMNYQKENNADPLPKPQDSYWVKNPAAGAQITGSSFSAFNLQRTFRVHNDSSSATGVYGANKVFADLATNSAGNLVYTRYTHAATSHVPADIIYQLTVSSDKKVAYVEFPNPIPITGGTLNGYEDPLFTDSGELDGDDFIYIPMAVRVTSTEDDVTVTLDGNNSMISSGTFSLGTASSAGTNAYVDDPKTARDEFPINMLIIKEQKIGAMGNGIFEIAAPSGYEFNETAVSCMEIIAENFGYNRGVTTQLQKGTSWTNGDGDYNIRWKEARNENDYSAIQVQLNTMGQNKSTNVGMAGTLILRDENLSTTGHSNHFLLYADDNASFDKDILLSMRNVSGSTGVTRQSDVKAGTRKDWTISLTTDGDIPTLINGRYYNDDAVDADDETHLAATVVMKENVQNAWWSGRVSEFKLPEGVKFRKVEIFDTENLQTVYEEALEDDFYFNTNKRNRYVTIHDNTLTMSGVEIIDKKKATLKMDMWLSVESGFEGDIELTLDGSAVPEEVASVVVAKAISPITLKAEVTPVQIGHQYFQVADITIQENVPGALEKNKEVWITVTDRIYQDMYFTPGYSVEVTEGNLKIKDKGIGSGNAIGVSSTKIRYGNNRNGGGVGDLGSGTIVLDVDGISSTASTIKLSNLQLKIDRTVPESTAGYDVYVWGPNIAPNSDVFDYSDAGLADVDYASTYEARANNDLHAELGIHTEYIQVTTPAAGAGSAVSAVVKVTVDNATAYRNGEAVTINPVAFIDSSSRLQVPVRALANLLGVTTEQIIWSDSDRTVTLNMPNRTIQFAIGSDIVLINGAQVRMDTEAMINNDWTFIPFRALGEALGVVVSWDDATKTATFNADKE